MMRRISENEAFKKNGIKTLHSVMDNYERRYRLLDENGIGYVRTDAGDTGAWQNSHLHRHLLETYIVQKNWIGFAILSDDRQLHIRLLKEGEILTTPLGVAHNIYMPTNSITHVVKHGLGNSDDWETNEDTLLLDQLTQPLSELQIVDGRT